MGLNKELIKNVLVKETENLSDDFTFDIKDNYILFADEGECQFEVNIYEFAFKCKEWALKKDFIISSYSRHRLDGYDCCIYDDNGDIDEDFISNTEIEAIIKACNWILEQQK